MGAIARNYFYRDYKRSCGLGELALLLSLAHGLLFRSLSTCWYSAVELEGEKKAATFSAENNFRSSERTALIMGDKNGNFSFF
jgi:hypothetical protein